MHNAHKLFLNKNNITFEKINKSESLEIINLTPNSPNCFVSEKKIELIVVHYTASSFTSSLNTFYNKESSASANFLIDIDGSVFNLIDESKRSYHAGKSAWRETLSMINSKSIGIEIVNQGFTKSVTWHEFSKEQISACMNLIKYLQTKYNISQQNIIGHSDINSKKQDPGPLFPWHELSQEGIGNWINTKLLNNDYDITPSISFLKNELKKYGYNITNDNIHNNAIIHNFRMHFVDNQKLDELDINISCPKKLHECCLFAFLLNNQ